MRSRSLALYVHIPFRQAKCPYCDFDSYAGLEAVMAPYVDALIAEMALWRDATRDPSHPPRYSTDAPTTFADISKKGLAPS
jgi:oxygen-independent coproporphyrinogen-3 oxidase